MVLDAVYLSRPASVNSPLDLIRSLSGISSEFKGAELRTLKPRDIQKSALTMAWPYHFSTLDGDQRHARRLLLDRYGAFAQLSAIVPVIIYQLYRLGVWVYSERQRSKATYSALSSPARKKHKHTTPGSAVRRWNKVKWWLEDDLASGWGSRGYWIAGIFWTSWLLFLCVHKTGDGTSSNCGSSKRI